MLVNRLFFVKIVLACAIFWIIGWVNPFQLEGNAAKVLGASIFTISCWVMEILPMPVVALFPLVLFPLFSNAGFSEVSSAYANPVIFLFLGGFMIGLAIEKWNLHRRIALNILRVTGTQGGNIVLGFILSTGFLSMWLSNTATTMMMYPIAMSVIEVVEKRAVGKEPTSTNLAICLLLSIAYASNFGGIATIIGTPPNVAYTAYLKQTYQYSFGFLDWMKIGLPMALLLMAGLYLVMTKWLFPLKLHALSDATEYVQHELKLIGKLSVPERRVLIIFIATAFFWVTRELWVKYAHWKLDDNIIALVGAIALFMVASGTVSEDGSKPRLLEWKDTQKMAWGILLLFGGGIALANQLEKVGLVQQIGAWLAQSAGSNRLVLVFVIAVVSIFLSEILSNVAQVIVFSPVLGGLADALQENPLLVITPMVLAASCASMLPMGTPPNAIVFASGRLKLADMIKTGFLLNLMAILLITLFCYYLLPLVVSPIQ